MTRRRSVAQARNDLPRLLHEVETSGEVIEITRHGRPVAVLIPVAHYRRLAPEWPSFEAAYDAFCRSHDLSELDPDPGENFQRDRRSDGGREFSW